MLAWKLPSSATLSLACVLNLTACAVPPQPLPPAPVRAAQRPPLPPEAMQPPDPDWCRPTCSAAVQRELQALQSDLSTWLNSLKLGRSPDSSASL